MDDYQKYLNSLSVEVKLRPESFRFTKEERKELSILLELPYGVGKLIWETEGAINANLNPKTRSFRREGEAKATLEQVIRAADELCRLIPLLDSSTLMDLKHNISEVREDFRKKRIAAYSELIDNTPKYDKAVLEVVEEMNDAHYSWVGIRYSVKVLREALKKDKSSRFPKGWTPQRKNRPDLDRVIVRIIQTYQRIYGSFPTQKEYSPFNNFLSQALEYAEQRLKISSPNQRRTNSRHRIRKCINSIKALESE